MARAVQLLADKLSRRRFLQRAAYFALVPTAVLVGAPTAAAAARRNMGPRDDPEVCAEWCEPINPGPCGCTQCSNKCFICNGCGDVNRLRCFSHSCSGFCWKPVC
jgi:hypothetical protein